MVVAALIQPSPCVVYDYDNSSSVSHRLAPVKLFQNGGNDEVRR